MIKVIWKLDNKELNLVNNPFFKIKISGIDIPPSELIGTTNPNRPGVQKKRIAVQKRTITIDFIIHSQVERVRQMLFEYFRPNTSGKLYLKSSYREAVIDAEVVDMPFERHELPVTAQLILECPYPYFKSLSSIVSEISNILNTFEFIVEFPEEGIELGTYASSPVINIDNVSDVPTGLTIKAYANQVIDTNLKITNLNTNEFIGIDVTMFKRFLSNYGITDIQPGDVIEINTTQGTGTKSVILIRNSVRYNIINALLDGSVWLQLPIGLSNFTYSVNEETSDNLKLKVFITRTTEYGAI